MPHLLVALGFKSLIDIFNKMINLPEN